MNTVDTKKAVWAIRRKYAIRVMALELIKVQPMSIPHGMPMKKLKVLKNRKPKPDNGMVYCPYVPISKPKMDVGFFYCPYVPTGLGLDDE